MPLARKKTLQSGSRSVGNGSAGIFQRLFTGGFCLLLIPGAKAADRPPELASSGHWILVAVALPVVALLVWVVTKSMRKKTSRSQPAKPCPRAEENLANRYRALFENANDLILGTGLDGQILYANNAWQETLDLSEQDLTSLSIFQVLHSESVDNFKTSFARAVVGVKIKNLEATFISKYGKRVVVEGSLHGELVDDKPVSIQGIFRDVTERKRSRSALKQSEERFSRVFAASPVAIGTITLDRGRFQDVNESFLKMLGYERDEVIGSTDIDLNIWLEPKDRQRIIEQANGQSVRDVQCQLRSKNGQVREALIAAELIELNVEKTLLTAVELVPERCLLLMIHDNTERLNLEAQLRQAQKMEGFGQLAAGIAHDFNNVLTVIQGHAARLRKPDGNSASIAESIEHVSVAADRAAKLTRQLLTFCRKQAVVSKVIQLNDTVTHISKMLERVLGADIALKLKLGRDLQPIYADSGMIEQIIMNLACNSRDAMERGGQLTISTSTVKITPADVQRRPKARLGVHVCITVTDTGCGMKPETLRRIFEPFYTTKDVGKGTGLGLATVYGIVDQHRGWLEVDSVIGKGTTFNVYIPASDKPMTTTVEPVSPVSARKGTETILLVEDEEPLRELARLVLEDHGYKVLEAPSGVQALKVWEEHKGHTDMLLTDMVMPEGMSGRDLAEHIQAEKPGFKVLYSSGYSPDVVGGHFKLPQNSYFLAKPYQPVELAQAVRECLENSRPLNSTAQKAQPAA